MDQEDGTKYGFRNRVVYTDHNGSTVCELDGSSKPGVQYIMKSMPDQIAGRTPFMHSVVFQDGNPAMNGVNGLTNEHLFAILVDRITRQDAKFPSFENKTAIAGARLGLEALEHRTANRKARGVEGQHIV